MIYSINLCNPTCKKIQDLKRSNIRYPVVSTFNHFNANRFKFFRNGRSRYCIAQRAEIEKPAKSRFCENLFQHLLPSSQVYCSTNISALVYFDLVYALSAYVLWVARTAPKVQVVGA